MGRLHVHAAPVIVAIVVVVSLGGCAEAPAERLSAYLGPTGEAAGLPEGTTTIDAALVILNDTTAPGSAPALSVHAMAFLADQVKSRIASGLPIRLVAASPSPEVRPTGDPDQFVRLASREKLPYVLLVVFSSAESEVPKELPLTGDPQQGGGRPFVEGFEAVNYALAELALLDGRTGRVVLSVSGRAWSRLNRLYVPIKSNAYPVIHRSLRVAPIYPREDNAKDILRSIAGDEALEQAVMHLQEVWDQRRPA